MPRSTQKFDPVEPTEGHVPVEPTETAETSPLVPADAVSADSAAEHAVESVPKTLAPDQFGRYRVLDKDTGHQRSIHAAELPHGNYEVLDEAASHPSTGEPLPPVHNTAVETNPSGQQAENKEELDA